MNSRVMKALREGDAVECEGVGFIVHGNYGNRIMVIRTVDITDPVQWRKANGHRINDVFDDLNPGSIVQGRASRKFFVVADVHSGVAGKTATGVDVGQITETNRPIWSLVRKA